MKARKNPELSGHLAPELQKRLMAYSTLAGLGVLFTGQKVAGQVVESQAFAPYPATLPAPTGTNVAVIPIDLTGNGTVDFSIQIFGEQLLPQTVNITGETTNTMGMPNVFLDSSAHSYLFAWLGGMTINSANGVPPTYQPRLAIDYYFLSAAILNNKFPVEGALGFEFVSSVDGQTHFGYMDVQVNSSTNIIPSENVITSVTVDGVYYNETPNAGITVPLEVEVSNINVSAENAVTIDFSSNTNAPASALTLETSPTLGSSATWTPDTNAVITQTTAANPNNKKILSYYQAITTATNTPTQFWRVAQTLSAP